VLFLKTQSIYFCSTWIARPRSERASGDPSGAFRDYWSGFRSHPLLYHKEHEAANKNVPAPEAEKVIVPLTAIAKKSKCD